MESKSSKIRVLVVEDSALARKILVEGLNKDPQIEVIGAARDGATALNYIISQTPDVITLDIKLPDMNGTALLRRYMPEHPTPTIIISAYTEEGIEALEAGAVDVVDKPRVGVVDQLPAMMADICTRVKIAARANVRRKNRATSPVAPANLLENFPESPDASAGCIIAIGASAGGVSALSNILPAFPATSPGIVIVQHMPGEFTAGFAHRLDSLSQVHVKEAAHGDRVRPGLALLAPGGNRHTEIHRTGKEYRIALVQGPKVSGHQPSVDVLFRSVARHAGKNCVAVLMTGMGEDGAAGLLSIRLAGGRTYCQDEASSVVWGMPGSAWKQGAAEALVSLDEIPVRLLFAIKQCQSSDQG